MRRIIAIVIVAVLFGLQPVSTLAQAGRFSPLTSAARQASRHLDDIVDPGLPRRLKRWLGFVDEPLLPPLRDPLNSVILVACGGYAVRSDIAESSDIAFLKGALMVLDILEEVVSKLGDREVKDLIIEYGEFLQEELDGGNTSDEVFYQVFAIHLFKVGVDYRECYAKLSSLFPGR